MLLLKLDMMHVLLSWGTTYVDLYFWLILIQIFVKPHTTKKIFKEGSRSCSILKLWFADWSTFTFLQGVHIDRISRPTPLVKLVVVGSKIGKTSLISDDDVLNFYIWNQPIHSIWFIRNTSKFQVVLFLNFYWNLSSSVAYLLLNFLAILDSVFLKIVSHWVFIVVNCIKKSPSPLFTKYYIFHIAI